MADGNGPGGNAPQWSDGWQLVTVPKAESAIPKPFSVTGWSLSYSLAVITGMSEFIGVPPIPVSFGRLSRIVAGLQVNPPAPNEQAQIYITTPPTDVSSLVALFDPAVDPLPPQYNSLAGPQVTDIRGTQLPQPVVIDELDTIAFGVWAFPFLAQNVEMVFLSGQYTIDYVLGDGT